MENHTQVRILRCPGPPTNSDTITLGTHYKPTCERSEPEGEADGRANDMVVVKVHAAALNPIDYKKIRDGLMAKKSDKYPTGEESEVADASSEAKWRTR